MVLIQCSIVASVECAAKKHKRAVLPNFDYATDGSYIEMRSQW